MDFDALILNARLRQSLATVRSLGRRGLRVAAVASAGRAVPTFASRWCAKAFEFPAEEAPDAYLSALDDWLGRFRAPVLITSHDGTIDLLRRHRDRFGPDVRVALAGEAALTVAVDKERTLAAARRLGLHVPREVVVRDAAGLRSALREIGLPAVVKPTESWVHHGTAGEWVGPRLVVDEAEAREAADPVTGSGAAVLYQEFLTGRREAVSFLYAKGEVHARFAQWAQRTRPPLGGESVLRQAIAVPEDIGRQAEALVREIDLEGYCEVEFRRDAAGVPYLMEINPRLSASVEVAIRAGVDFPWLVYQWASAQQVDRVEGYRVGGWMRHLGADIDTTLSAVLARGRPGTPAPGRAVLDFGRSFLRPAGYDYFSWRDPGPAVAATAGFVRDVARRAVARARRMNG